MEAPYSSDTDDTTDAREANVLAELYDALDFRPRDVEIHQMLIHTWVSLGEPGKQIPALLFLC